MPIKTFRGLLSDQAQDTIVLHTNDGSTGYKIVKFELMPLEPGISSAENVVKVYKIEQTVINGDINFNDNTLLAAGYYQSEASSYTDWQQIVFDNEVFNQDIFVTNFDARTGEGINYYLELEQVKLDLNSNTVATLKDLRNESALRPPSP